MAKAARNDDFFVDAELCETTLLDGETKVADLWSVRTAEEAIGKFGFTPGDRISRRDQIQIYERIRDAVRDKKEELIAGGHYEEVIQLEDTVCEVKRQFQYMQLNDVEREQKRQLELHKIADKISRTSSSCKMQEEGRRVEEVCSEQKAQLDQRHSAQRETLELEISWLLKPRTKYSNRYLELEKTKAGLLRLHRYKEAHTVHKMLMKLKPMEEKAFLAEYDKQIDLKRLYLAKRQTQEREKLQEFLVDFRLLEARKCRENADNLKNKMENSKRSMVHAHTMVLNRRPELCQNPSAHWQKRANYKFTAAALRGEQLVQAVKGRPSGAALKSPTLQPYTNLE